MFGLNKNNKSSRIRKNKKGVVFTATIGFFFISLIILAVLVYRGLEQNEEKIISNSLATQIINLEDSVQLSVKRIYEAKNNITLNLSSINSSGISYDIATMKTTLLALGNPITAMDNEIDLLKTFAESKFNYITIDSSSLKSNLFLERGNGTGFWKTSIDPSISTKESLIIYYNRSGENKGLFYGMNITINSDLDMQWIINSNSLPSSGSFLLNITINDTNLMDVPVMPEWIEDSKLISFGTIDPSSSYSWVVNDSNNITTFFNITLDYEKLNITVMHSLVNVTDISASLITSTASTRPYFYFAPNAIIIEMPRFQAKKVSNVRFR